MSSMGLEGDTRKFKHLRNTDYYALKAANDALKRDPKHFVACKVCGQAITGQNYGGFCLRCKDEPL
jgi:RNA polymerase-binding transcription factor DksA